VIEHRRLCALSTCGLLVLIFISGASSQTFDSEAKLRNTVRIPPVIVAELEKADEVKECLDRSESPKFTASWFRAVRVSMTGSARTDYLIKNDAECLNGPRAANWWIFSGSGRRARLVFHDSVLWLSILKRKTRRFRDIQTETVFVNIIRNTWRYNGREYKLVKTKFIEPGK
jgi:hypothetical protein